MRAFMLSLRRLAAFFFDLCLLTIATFSLVGMFFHIGLLDPSPKVSLAIVWLWILYFGIMNWATKGTVGKLLFRLKLVGKNGERIALLTSIGRSILLLPITAILVSVASPSADPGSTKVQFLAAASLAGFLLFVTPVSIFAFSGSRSVVDLICGTYVLPRRSSYQPSFSVDWRRSIVMVCLAMSCGILVAVASYFFLGRLALRTEERGMGSGAPVAQFAGENEPLMKEISTTLSTELTNPQSLFGAVTLLTPTENYEVDEDISPVSNELRESLSKQLVPVIQVQLRPIARDSSFVRFHIMQSLASGLAPRVDPAEMPAFFGLELFDQEDYGVFEIKRSERVLLCLTSSGSTVYSQYLEPTQKNNLTVYYSLDLLRFLFLGKVDRYRKMRS
jgi:uncharacterized RDD family membrane protein YckC